MVCEEEGSHCYAEWSTEFKKILRKVKRLACSFVALTLSQTFFGCATASGKELKVITQKTIELGDPVSLNPANYLLDVPSDEVLNEIEVSSPLKSEPKKYTYNDFSQTVTSNGKDYLSTGTYTLTLDYKGEKYPVTLLVEDTVMPEFVSPAAVVTIPLGTTYFDFSNVYKTKDKDEVTLKVEGDYDLNTVGIYPVTLLAEDRSGNSNSLEITINVLGNNRQIKASDQFDYEYVPKEELTSTSTTSSEDKISIPSSTENSTHPTPIACNISQLPQGSQAFYSFSELYSAGSAWNKLSANNYFYYIEFSDDCGNKVYALTTGTTDKIPSSNDTEPAETPTLPDSQPSEPTVPIIPNVPSEEPTLPSDEDLPGQETPGENEEPFALDSQEGKTEPKIKDSTNPSLEEPSEEQKNKDISTSSE